MGTGVRPQLGLLVQWVAALGFRYSFLSVLLVVLWDQLKLSTPFERL